MLARQLPGLTRPWRSMAAVVAVAALAAPVSHQPAASVSAAFQPVSYRGYTFEVPSSWLVVRLGSSETCVRFDVSVVYLGNPAADQACPSLLVGTTQALLIQPGPKSSAQSSVENPVAREITVTAPKSRSIWMSEATRTAKPAIAVRPEARTAGWRGWCARSPPGGCRSTWCHRRWWC